MVLSQTDFLKWFEVLKSRSKYPSDMISWVQDSLTEFLPFERFFCAHGYFVAGEVKITHWLACGHEQSYLQQIAQTFELHHRGSLGWWLANRQPFYISSDNTAPYVTQFEIDEIKIFNLKNVAAHGILNLKANAGTYFSFVGLQEPLTDWHLDVLSVITPVLNDMFLAYIAEQETQLPNLSKLTKKQIEIVRRISQGLDDKTIARELSISEKTVRNQLTSIYASLGVSKRAQLITMLR